LFWYSKVLRRDDAAPFLCMLANRVFQEEEINFSFCICSFDKISYLCTMKGKKIRRWLRIMALLTVIAGLSYACSSADGGDEKVVGTAEEQRYDELQLEGDWQGIIDEAKEHPVLSPACQKVLRLAQYRTGLAGNEALIECLQDSRKVLTSERAALMMSDLYMQLGMPNMAQRAAFETLVTTELQKHRTRALQRLTETALISMQIELARKYIAILEVEGVNKKWLQVVKPLAENPELIGQYPAYQKLRQNYESLQDQFFM